MLKLPGWSKVPLIAWLAFNNHKPACWRLVNHLIAVLASTWLKPAKPVVMSLCQTSYGGQIVHSSKCALVVLLQMYVQLTLLSLHPLLLLQPQLLCSLPAHLISMSLHQDSTQLFTLVPAFPNMDNNTQVFGICKTPHFRGGFQSSWLQSKVYLLQTHLKVESYLKYGLTIFKVGFYLYRWDPNRPNGKVRILPQTVRSPWPCLGRHVIKPTE